MTSRVQIEAAPLASGAELPETDAEAAREADIQQRVAALEAGTLKPEPREDVRSRIEKGLRR